MTKALQATRSSEQPHTAKRRGGSPRLTRFYVSAIKFASPRNVS
jgi:hypothetical protein